MSSKEEIVNKILSAIREVNNSIVVYCSRDDVECVIRQLRAHIDKINELITYLALLDDEYTKELAKKLRDILTNIMENEYLIFKLRSLTYSFSLNLMNVSKYLELKIQKYY